MIENIYFIGDPYRGEQDVNIEKIKNLFSPLLDQLGVQYQTFITDVNKSRDRNSWVKSWSDSLRIYPSPVLSSVDLTNSAVIGFEVPDGELSYLSSHGTKWINFSLHPIRFMDDLRLEVRSSFEFDLSRVLTPYAAIKFAANELKKKYSVGRERRDTLLICGQDWIDRSIFFDGEFKQLDSYFSKIDLLANQTERVLFKPHPANLNNKICNLISDRYSAEICEKKDFYEVLSTENISTLCAISSSVVIEAPFFDVQSVFLESRAQRYGPPVDYRLLLNDSDFWLHDFIGLEKFDSSFQVSNHLQNNILRKTFGAWSFVSDEARAEERFQSLNRLITKVQIQAEQAEAKAEQAEAKAEQAEAKAEQAEAKAEQAEAKAQQAQATSGVHVAKLHAVYASTSWRITAPLRWVVTQLRLLRDHGFKKRSKSAVKKILRKVVPWLVARPKLKSFATQVAHSLGIAQRLKPLVRSLFASHQQFVYEDSSQKISADLTTLTPRARQIYHDLKLGIEIKQRGG